ncbi:MAG: hypothetical protein JOZ39_02720 [Chloroflexi bacterium]|nr:hypothetical protein [Chloroflexota bacterium]
MAQANDPDLLKLVFLRELVQAARDPEAESFPLMELAGAIVGSALTPAMLLRKAHQPLPG